ncbi:hypothetical protein [Streptomyces sp. sk2.1]|uniref:hypothetical protein n=1 Tax=Streptomyces sp. sk2.1 TaxID=2478959 RepID=UPI0011E81FA4|nr:hypothetical protein [Streptomyces sp. sk2.1]TXS76058.1 hypothetical protein EAO76_11535 [Streptomyces sp. sk2.1]
MNRELLHGDLCPLCRHPLTLRPKVVVHSNVPYSPRTDYQPHCNACANDLPNAQRWNDLMNDRYGL